MSKFEKKKVEAIKAREDVDQLVVSGVGQLDDFEGRLKGTTYRGEFAGLLAFIEHFANGGEPGSKVLQLKGVKDGVTEYEFKSKHLRIYAIQQPNGKLIVYGGTKKAADSSDNISDFRLIKTKYLQSLKNTK